MALRGMPGSLPSAIVSPLCGIVLLMTTTAEILAADAETHTDPWWENGKNVTFVARWAADNGYPAQTICAIYERPWDCDGIWTEAWSWVIESL